jgi:hypothetical protein
MPKDFKVKDLGNESTKAFRAMVGPGAPQTCYDLAIYSLVKTGDLKEAVYRAWIGEIPKANTLLVVDPAIDTRVTDPDRIPGDSIIGFYRRFSKGGTSQLEAERKAGWVIYHMVRSIDANSTRVLGGNNGDRDGTKPSWSGNDVKKMFDWGGTEETSMAPMDSIPEAGSYGKDGKQQFVAYAAPITTVVARLKRAFPGVAAFG